MERISRALGWGWRAWGGPIVLIALMVWILHRALFSGGQFVPAWPYTDLFSEYMPWRHFAFWQWRLGQFPWWDPHIFCGFPFFAQIQSCLFYPIAWINFFLNPFTATTLESVLNLAIGAICMYAWARSRGISRCGATLAGAAFPLSGAIYPHVLDGYLTVMGSAAWMPLIFLALDRLLAERFASGILIGAIAVCLENLAGHSQLVYYTFLIGGLYVVLESIGRQRVVRLYAGFTAMWALGGMLAAIQLLPTYFANQISVRAGGISYGYAAMLSLPPENLMTILIPYPFGGTTGVPYLGRWLLWEATLYTGIVAFALACIGIGDLKKQSRWRMLVVLAGIIVLILGVYTPIHWYLYKFLPGFGLFRCPAKFDTLWALLIAVLAGHGWDQVAGNRVGKRAIWLTAIAAGICLALAAIVYHFDSDKGPAGRLMAFIFHTREFIGPVRYFHSPQIVQLTAHRIGMQWAIAAALLAGCSLLIYLRRFSINAAYFLLIIAIGDVYIAAAACNTLTPSRQVFPQQWTAAVATATQHDQRVLFCNGITDADLGDVLGYSSIWGYGPGQPKRLTLLIAASQGQHPQWADEYEFQINQPSRIFQLLRCGFVLQWNGKYPTLKVQNPLPHLKLIGDYVRMNDPDSINDHLTKDFDFWHSAILESDPQLAPTAEGATGQVKLLRQSNNDLEIQADLPAPALLLITDAYAPGWQVRTIDANPNQPDYQVLQADSVLRAIPLAAGHHHFDLYYTAPGFYAGICISALAAIACIGISGMILVRRNSSGHITPFAN